MPKKQSITGILLASTHSANAGQSIPTTTKIKSMKKQLLKLKKIAGASCLLVGVSSIPAHAAPILLNFEGIGNGAVIGAFYNGGTDSAGHAGTNFGISFNAASIGVIDSDAGGTGSFANEPSASTIAYFTSTGLMNVASGFTTALTFYYSSNTTDAIVTVYDGLNGTGNQLGSLSLAQQATANNCFGDPTGASCNWTPAGISFSGIGKSVSFGGTATLVGYDNIGLNLASIPEPSSLALFGLGFAVFRSGHKRVARI